MPSHENVTAFFWNRIFKLFYCQPELVEGGILYNATRLRQAQPDSF